MQCRRVYELRVSGGLDGGIPASGCHPQRDWWQRAALAGAVGVSGAGSSGGGSFPLTGPTGGTP